MSAWVLGLLIIEGLITTIFATYLQGSQYFQVPGQQYYQVPNTPTHSGSHPYVATHSHAVNSYIPPAPSVYQPTTLSNDYAYSSPTQQITYKPPTTPVTSITPVQQPKVSPINPTPTNPKPSPTLPPKGFDSNVLNNLAIALQLLIVSNLLNSPISDSLPNIRNALQPKTEYETIQPPSHSIYPSNEVSQYPQIEDYQAYFETNPYESSNPQPSYPNANYLGSTHNLGSVLGSIPPATPRQGLKLQSPYDALANGFKEHSPVFDHNKRDFQSPYAAILAADNMKDLFSMDFY